MAKKLRIRSAKDDEGNLFMYPKPDIMTVKKKGTFEIVNKVNSEKPIRIKFYDIDHKGQQGKAIANFCKDMDEPKVLKLDKGESFECELSAPGQKYFAYTVKNRDAQELDPVIIIEDAVGIGGGIFPLTAMIVAGVGGAALGAAGFAFFSRKTKTVAPNE